MNGVVVVFVTLLMIIVPVAIARWVFRVNRQIQLLEQIAADIKKLADR